MDLFGIGMDLFKNNRASKQQKEIQNRSFSMQKKLNQQGHDLQMDMWNKTNYGAQLGHMKDAGLNPALMYGMSGGGGATTGSQGGGSAPGGSQPRQMDLQLIKAQKENVEADTEKKSAETDNIRGVEGTQGAQSIAESIARTAGINAQEAKTIQETLNLKTIDGWNKVKEKLDELKMSKNVTGSQVTDVLSNLGLDPVNNPEDMKVFRLMVGAWFGASMVDKLTGSLKNLIKPKKGDMIINNIAK